MGISGYITRASTAQPHVAFSNSPFTDAQLTPDMLEYAMVSGEDDADHDADVRPVEALDLQRLDVLDLGGRGQRGAELLERLAELLLTLGDPGGSAAGCTSGITSARRSLPSPARAAAVARSVSIASAVCTITEASSRFG